MAGPRERGRQWGSLPRATPPLLPCALGLLLACSFWEASSLGALVASGTQTAAPQEERKGGEPGAPRGDLYAALGVPRGTRPEGVSAGLSRAALEWWQGAGRCTSGTPAGIGRALEVYHAGTVLTSPVFRPAYDVAGLDALAGPVGVPGASQKALPACCLDEPSGNATEALRCARDVWESLTGWGPEEVAELASSADRLAPWPASSQAVTRDNIWEGLFSHISPWVVLLFSPAAPVAETEALQALWASLRLRLEGMVRQGHVDVLREPQVALRLSRAVSRGALHAAPGPQGRAVALPIILGRPQGCRHVQCLVPFPFRGPLLASALVHSQPLGAQGTHDPSTQDVSGSQEERGMGSDSDSGSESEDSKKEAAAGPGPAPAHASGSEDLVSTLEYFALVGMAPPKPIPLLPLAKVGPEFFNKAPGNKVRVLVLLEEGALGPPPALRFWAARLARQTHWAGVHWVPRETPVWDKWWRVDRPPALGIYRDPRQDPLVFQGPFNASMLRAIFERYSNFELPQLRPDTAAALGCDPTNIPVPSAAAHRRWARPVPVRPRASTGAPRAGSETQKEKAGTCGGEGAGAECAAEGNFSSPGPATPGTPLGSVRGDPVTGGREEEQGEVVPGPGMVRLLPGAVTRYCAVVVSSPSPALADARMLLLEVQRALGRAAQALGLPKEGLSDMGAGQGPLGGVAEAGAGAGAGGQDMDLGLEEGEGEEEEGGLNRRGEGVPEALARAWQEGRLTLAWLDGSKQTPYCSFMLGWEGAQFCRKEGKEAGVGLYLSLFRPQLPWQDHSQGAPPSRLPPGAPLGQAVGGGGGGADFVPGFSLLVSLFRDGPLNDSQKIVDWMGKAVEQGDQHAQFPLSRKVPPGLQEEEASSFWDGALEFAKGVLGRALRGLEPLLDRLGLLPYLQAGVPGWRGLGGAPDPTSVLKPIMLALFLAYLSWRLLGRA